MVKNMHKKILTVVGITILFLGIAVQPSIATVQQEEEIIDILPKDYLFQTIIEIANNPDVKSLLEQSNYDLFKVDIDRNVYRKLLLRNPRLFFNMLFTKPSINYEYLDKCYNRGIEITNILGEDKVFEMIESIEIIDTQLFDKINNIVMSNGELSGRFAILEEMNKELKPDMPFIGKLILCSILFIVAIGGIVFLIFDCISILLFAKTMNEGFIALHIIFTFIYLILINPFASFCLGWEFPENVILNDFSDFVNDCSCLQE